MRRASWTLMDLGLFQGAWFAAVLGAANGMAWLGPAAVAVRLAVHLFWTDDRRGELRLALAAGLLGLLFDTGMVAAGVFAPLHHLAPHPISPPWMVALWLNFAAALNGPLAWLRGRDLLGALFGALGGPLAYYAGATLGATEGLPSGSGLLALAAGWAIMVPLLVRLAQRLRGGGPARARPTP